MIPAMPPDLTVDARLARDATETPAGSVKAVGAVPGDACEAV